MRWVNEWLQAVLNTKAVCSEASPVVNMVAFSKREVQDMQDNPV
ncbi:hypothetical protein ACKGJN_03675 [Gillisia sp. Q332]